MIVEFPVREFTAWGHCPKCNHYAVHDMELPSGAPAAEEKEVEDHDPTVFVTFADGTVVRSWGYVSGPRYAANRSTCATVRLCVSCRAAWGER